jgi:molecular chaperone DnaK (HSP70)
MENYLAYVGIDFGTSGSTFSYCFPNSTYKDILVKKWENVGTSNKIETEIIVDENFNEIKAFGKEQCVQFSRKPNSLHFSNVKMNLYKNQFEISDNYSHKKFKLIDVIAKFLEKIRDEAIKELKTKRKSLRDLPDDQCINSIKWLITVPAIWSEKHKTCMIEAAMKAKLLKKTDDPSNFFALEPEAAACHYVMSNNSDKEICENPYIVCDIGGGTTDITTHERKVDKKGNFHIIELYQPVGGADGSREINRYILEEILVKKLFTQKSYDKIIEIIKKENEADDSDLKYEFNLLNDNINKFKHSFELKKINEKYMIKLEAFKEGFDEEPNLEELVNNYNKNIKEGWKIEINNKKKWILAIPYKIIYDLFKELIVDKATKYIKNIIDNLNNRNLNKKEIKSIIFAGGASSNLSLIDLFRETLPNLKLVTCDEPEIAVVKGAIYFAKNPFYISQRIAKFSLGIESLDDWNDKLDNIPEAKKYFDETRNTFICINKFGVYYKKNFPIKVIDKGITREFDMRSEQCRIQFYKSDYDGPVYVTGQKDENGNEITEKFAELYFKVEDFDQNEPGVKITIKLGGTFISAQIKYLKTKKKFFQTFKFS